MSARWSETGFDNTFALDSAVVLIRSGDLEGYGRLARAMLDLFIESKDPMVADATAKVNLLLPPAERDWKRLEMVAQHAVDADAGGVNQPWFFLARGMAAYRIGEFAAAVRWLERAGQSDLGADHGSTWRSYLAMAETRLGHSERARILLAEAGERIGERAAQRDVGAGWHNLRIAEMARREADTLINPAIAPTAGPPRP